MEKVLVLNNDYTPLNVTTLKRGFKLVYKGKAEIIFSDDDNPIVSTVKTFKRPTIIRLMRYILLPYKKVQLSRYNIYRIYRKNERKHQRRVETLLIDLTFSLKTLYL